MDDRQLLVRCARNVRTLNARQAEHSRGLHVIRLPGVEAYVLTARPHLTWCHRLFYDDADALAEAVGPLRELFRGAGVASWRIGVYEQDERAISVLTRAGYQKANTVRVMGQWTRDLPMPRDIPTAERPGTLGELLAINVEAYAPADLALDENFRGFPASAVHPVLVYQGGAPRSAGFSFDSGDTAGIYLVATKPAARGLGLATQVMHALHADAIARGCKALVLQASDPAHALYRHLGYRDLGSFQFWVGLSE